MFRLNKRWLLQLAAVYYIALFICLRHYYNRIEAAGEGQGEGGANRDAKSGRGDVGLRDMVVKVEELSQLSNGLTRNLMNLHGQLSDTLGKNISQVGVASNFRNGTQSQLPSLANQTRTNSKLERELFEKMSNLTKGMIKPEDMIVHIDHHGDLHINKTVLLKHLRNALRKWDYEHESMAFMHIGKNGGTSFRAGLTKAKHDNGCRLKSQGGVARQEKHPCPGQVPCVCNRHYDWTVIDDLKRRGVRVAPVTLLRDPVKRANSHFYFAKTLPWTKKAAIRNQSLKQYLSDPQSMLDTRDVWQDGQVRGQLILFYWSCLFSLGIFRFK